MKDVDEASMILLFSQQQEKQVVEEKPQEKPEEKAVTPSDSHSTLNSLLEKFREDNYKQLLQTAINNLHGHIFSYGLLEESFMPLSNDKISSNISLSISLLHRQVKR